MMIPAPQPASEARQKRLHIKTYGCQMNVYDSERMADVLRPLGYALSDEADGADLVVLNTCHIREKAAEKVYSEIGRLRELRDAGIEAGEGRMTIAVAGCVAQAEGAEIMTRAPAVDLVVGPQAYHQLPELIARVGRSRGERLAADFAPDHKFDALPVQRRASGPSAFLTVQEGCDKFCSFCVVPYTRGAEYARPVEAVLAEARSLAEQGVRELTLLGPKRQRLCRRRAGRGGVVIGAAGPGAGADRGAGAPALHHQPPARHGRGPDRRPRRGRGADALPAPAGPVGLGPGAEGDEPRSHRPQAI